MHKFVLVNPLIVSLILRYNPLLLEQDFGASQARPFRFEQIVFSIAGLAVKFHSLNP